MGREKKYERPSTIWNEAREGFVRKGGFLKEAGSCLKWLG